jgi:hypothetical protein
MSILYTIVCLFVPFPLAIAFSVLRITASDYPVGKFNICLYRNSHTILWLLQLLILFSYVYIAFLALFTKITNDDLNDEIKVN